MKRISLTLISFLTIVILFAACSRSDFSASEKAIPGSYSSEQDGYDQNNRKVIKTAQISLTVDHLEQSILNFKTFLKPINGYVYNYEIKNHSYEADHFQKNMDSSVSVQKVIPEGTLSIRVPINQADTFINYVLNSDAQIASLKINDDDITENLWSKKQMSSTYSNSGKAQNRKGNSKSISYDNHTSINAIKAKALAAKMDYQTKYLWFDISMTAKPFYKSTTALTAKNYRTPIHVSFVNAIVKGWYICADMILALVTIWPIIIFLVIGLFIYRKYRLRQT